MESAPFILMLNTIKWPVFWRVLSKVNVEWRSSVNISMPFIVKDSLEGVTWFSRHCKARFPQKDRVLWKQSPVFVLEAGFLLLVMWGSILMAWCWSSQLCDCSWSVLQFMHSWWCLPSAMFIFSSGVLWLGVFQVAQNYLLWVNYPQADA